MKKTFLLVFNVVLISIFLLSCGSEKSRKPRSTGTTNEMLVVTNTKTMWNGELGEVIRSYFGQEMAGLPQPEPMFDFMNVDAQHFSKLYRKFHNIFIVDIDPSRKETFVETKEDFWSQPQRIIKISAPSEEAFAEKFVEQREAYLRLYNQTEIMRTIRNFEMANDLSISNKLAKNYNLFLAVPGGFNIAKLDTNFVWLRHTVEKVMQDVEMGIMIYIHDYTDTASFNHDNIIRLRNKMTFKHIPGPTEGSFMKVADRHVPPVFSIAQDFEVDYAVETRGLWELQNDFMGGAFINYTFVDEKRNRVITLDGYVYYPNQLKRNYVRHIESILRTIELL